MSLHPDFPTSPYVPLLPIQRMILQYTQRMKQRHPELRKGWVQVVHTVSEAFKGWRQIATSLGLQFDSAPRAADNALRQ